MAFSLIPLLGHFYLTDSGLGLFVSVFGLFYGAMWCTNGMVYSFTSLPVDKHFSFIMAVINPLTGVGSFLLNLGVGILYDKHAVEGVCFGTVCFSKALMVMGIVAAPILPLTIALAIVRYRKSYV